MCLKLFFFSVWAKFTETKDKQQDLDSLELYYLSKYKSYNYVFLFKKKHTLISVNYLQTSYYCIILKYIVFKVVRRSVWIGITLNLKFLRFSLFWIVQNTKIWKWAVCYSKCITLTTSVLIFNWNINNSYLAFFLKKKTKLVLLEVNLSFNVLKQCFITTFCTI